MVVELLGIDHFAISVRDFSVSADWYYEIFGFSVIHKWDNAWLVGRGNVKVGLFAFPKATPLRDGDSNLIIRKIAFSVDGNRFAEALDTVKSKGVAIVGPDDTGIAYRFQFSDPDGHLLEITTFHTDGAPVGLAA